MLAGCAMDDLIRNGISLIVLSLAENTSKIISRMEHIHMEIDSLESIEFITKKVLGNGGFGPVYKGILRNQIIALKKTLNCHIIEDKMFHHEVKSLMMVKLRNVVLLRGYCSDAEQQALKMDGEHIMAQDWERLLCFEYLIRLKNYLTDELQGFEWQTRYQIIKGTCDAVHYLHGENHIVHMDLKPANILLDSNMVPKKTDFSLSRLDNISQTMSSERALKMEGELIMAQDQERLLCFEINDSFERSFMDESCGLDWPTCYKIIRGTCEGLNHLHNSQEKPTFHLGFKPSNILLDKDNLKAKLGGFGISTPITSAITTVIVREIVGFISSMSDIFSLGAIIRKAENKGYSRCYEFPPKQSVELVIDNWKEKLQSTSGHSSDSKKKHSTYSFSLSLLGGFFIDNDGVDYLAEGPALQVTYLRPYFHIFAVVAAALTYQASMSTPGALWQENKADYVVGDLVLKDNHRDFFYCNFTAFVSSVAIIPLLVNRKIFARRILSNTLSVCEIIYMIGLTGAFAAVSPKWASTSKDVLMLVFAVLVYIALQVLVRVGSQSHAEHSVLQRDNREGRSNYSLNFVMLDLLLELIGVNAAGNCSESADPAVDDEDDPNTGIKRSPRDAIWRVASAASHHMTGNQSLLLSSSYMPVHDGNEGHGVFVPPSTNGEAVPLRVHGSGSVRTDSITLDDVWYVPGLDSNLVSSGQLARQGCAINLGRGGGRITRGGTVVGTARFTEACQFELDFLKVAASM